MEKFNLNGIWEFKDVKDKESMKGYVPGEVHIDLLKNGIIKDPFFGKNIEDLRKYEGKRWVYWKEFFPDKNLIERCKKIELVFEGIDNHSIIYLNGEKIGETKNSFIPFSFDITEIIEEKNKIEIFIDDGYSLVPDKIPEKYLSFRGEREREVFGRIFLRKPQYVFGWDWTERLITCGIWKDVYINFYDNLAIRDIWIKKWDKEKIEIETEIENFNEKEIDSEIIIKIEEKEEKFKNKLMPGKNILSFNIELPYLKLWYPRGTGEPYLYKLQFILKNKEIEDKRDLKFGLRKIDIIQEDDGEGKSFIVSVNGKKVFCKGANWIPPDTIFPRINNEKYRKLIEIAEEENFNMLRVWGGGIYEDEYFYNLCDEKGIMLWHDFMFACAYYPDDNEEFLKNFDEEIEKIVKKLRNHPSIVLWCGNNENHTIYYSEKKKNPEKIFYGKYLFEEFIPEKLKTLDPDRFYWPSSDYSPSGDDPKSMKEGDRHSWYIPEINLEEYYKKGERYFFLQDKAKFVSEFGRLSFMPEKTIFNFMNEKKVNLKDPDFVFHSNTFGRPHEIVENLKRFYGERIEKMNDTDIIKISQLHQGYAIEFALKYYGSRKYRTAGSLFWMFEDSWPTSSSWVVCDYYLNKTPLFYFVKRAFNDFYIFINPEYLISDNFYSIYFVNHRYENFKGEVCYGISDFYGKKIFQEKVKIDVPPDSSFEIFRTHLLEIEDNKYFIFAYLVEDKRISDFSIISSDISKLILPEGKIEVNFSKDEVILKSNIFHICVETDIEEDNFFPLLPDVEYKIKTKEKITPKSLNYLFSP